VPTSRPFGLSHEIAPRNADFFRPLENSERQLCGRRGDNGGSHPLSANFLAGPRSDRRYGSVLLGVQAI